MACPMDNKNAAAQGSHACPMAPETVDLRNAVNINFILSSFF
jgi:hypothetical protein